MTNISSETIYDIVVSDLDIRHNFPNIKIMVEEGRHDCAIINYLGNVGWIFCEDS